MERMTAADAFRSHPDTARHTVLFDGLIGVLRARGRVDTCIRKNGGYIAPIYLYRTEARLLGDRGVLSCFIHRLPHPTESRANRQRDIMRMRVMGVSRGKEDDLTSVLRKSVFAGGGSQYSFGPIAPDRVSQPFCSDEGDLT